MRVLFVAAYSSPPASPRKLPTSRVLWQSLFLMVCLRRESFFVHDTAETMLARVLVDELEWEESLRVEPVELATGGLN